MAAPHESDDPTEAVTALATQMEITGTSGSSASDIVEMLEVNSRAVSTLPQAPEGTAGGYVTNMTSGWMIVATGGSCKLIGVQDR
jgi:hypothetical protein